MERMAHKVLQDLQEVQQDQQAFRDLLVFKGHLEQREILGQVDLLVLMVLQVQQDLLEVRPVSRVQQAPKVQQDHREQQVSKV